jgi:PAS domain-containing protein
LQVVHWDLQLAPDLLAEKILLHLRILSPAPSRPGLPDKDTLQINYHHMLAHSPDPVLLLHAADLSIIDSNQHARRLFGLTEAELLQTHFDALCPPTSPMAWPRRCACKSVSRRTPAAHLSAARSPCWAGRISR